MSDVTPNEIGTPKDRAELAKNACWEVEALMDLILTSSPDMDELALRGVVLRAKTLSAIAANLTDDEEPIAELWAEVHGVKMPEAPQ